MQVANFKGLDENPVGIGETFFDQRIDQFLTQADFDGRTVEVFPFCREVSRMLGFRVDADFDTSFFLLLLYQIDDFFQGDDFEVVTVILGTAQSW